MTRRNYNQRKRQFQYNVNQNQNTNLSLPGSVGIKNIKNRRAKYWHIKINKAISQFKNVEVKHRGRVVRRVVVRGKSIYPTER